MSDPKRLTKSAVVADAIERGICAEDQYQRLMKACSRCKQKRPIPENVDTQIKCMEACERAMLIEGNEDAINRGIFGDTPARWPKRPEQDLSDKNYDRTYWQFAHGSRKRIQAAFDHVAGQPSNMLNRAYGAALFDLLNGNPYYPPMYHSNDPPPEWHHGQVEQPDTGEMEMRASSVRPRSRGAGSRRQPVDDLMPVAGYWMVDEGNPPTMHFCENCPTAPTMRSDFELLDEAVHPGQLARDHRAHPCGSCLRLLENEAKNGFLFGNVGDRHTLHVWRDRIDYESDGWGGTQWSVPVGDLADVAFPSRSMLVLSVPDLGEVEIDIGTDASGDVAREAFRRLGWDV